MNIEILWAGVTLQAEVNYTPGEVGYTWGRPEDCYPPEEEEMEILDLKCDGKDVNFLLETWYGPDIEDKVAEKVQEEVRKDVERSAEDRAADILEDRELCRM